MRIAGSPGLMGVRDIIETIDGVDFLVISYDLHKVVIRHFC
jgi:hypothetical protein